MKHVSIEVDGKWKLRYLDFRVDYEAFDRLLESVSDQRKARFRRIVISGGVAVQAGFSRTAKRYASLDLLDLGKSHGFIYGYFDPARGEILLFPETILEVVAAKCGGRLPSLISGQIRNDTRMIEQVTNRAPASSVLAEFEKEFYPMLIEELEHGFQDGSETKYRSLSMKFFGWTTRFIPLYLMITVSYVIFTQKSYWWFGLIFLGMIVWMFFPVWFAYIPRPKWWRKLRYSYNRREKDAKGKAVSRLLFKLAQNAIRFDLK